MIIHDKDYSAHVGEYKRILKRSETSVSTYVPTDSQVKIDGASTNRSLNGDNLLLAMSVASDVTIERPVSIDKRNQSFSVSTKSKRVKTSAFNAKGYEVLMPEKTTKFDPRRMLHMSTDVGKMADAASKKRQNNRTPYDALQRIENKISELLVKLERAIRQGTDKTALDALLVRCNYYRHREIVRLAELQVTGDQRDAEKAKVMLPASEVPVFERPVMPTSLGRTYKVKRKLVKDRITKHGSADKGHVAIKPRSKRKPRKAKIVRRGSGSY